MNEHSPDVSARLDRTQIDTLRDTTAFLIVEVTAPEVEDDASRPEQPLNLGLVIDASGSMGGAAFHGQRTSRLEAARQAGSGVADRLSEDDVLSVVSFADDTLTHIAATSMSDSGRASASDAIRSIHTRGCTDMGAGWLKGAEHVARFMEQHPGTRNRLLLLSDGHANRGVTEPDQLADTAAGLRDRGVNTSTVGIGLDYSTDQLEVLAEHGGGMMHHAEHPEDIVAVILAELNEMRTSVIADLAVSVSQDEEDVDDSGNPPPSLNVSPVGYVSRDDDKVMTTPLGSLVSGACRRVIFRINVPQVRTRTDVTLTISVSWQEDEDNRKTDTQQVTLTLDPNQSNPRDRGLAKLAAQAWLDETVRRVMVMNRRERYEQIRHWAKPERALFQHYCSRLREGDELIGQMNRLFDRVTRSMREMHRKEVSLRHMKGLKGMRDSRVLYTPRDLDSYLDEE
jgi:Ca-activated chloride channel family protein